MTLARLALKEPFYPAADEPDLLVFDSERSGLLGLRNEQLIHERFMERPSSRDRFGVSQTRASASSLEPSSARKHFIILNLVCALSLGVLLAAIFSAFAAAVAGSVSVVVGSLSAAFVGVLISGACLFILRDLSKKSR